MKSRKLLHLAGVSLCVSKAVYGVWGQREFAVCVWSFTGWPPPQGSTPPLWTGFCWQTGSFPSKSVPVQTISCKTILRLKQTKRIWQFYYIAMASESVEANDSCPVLWMSCAHISSRYLPFLMRITTRCKVAPCLAFVLPGHSSVCLEPETMEELTMTQEATWLRNHCMAIALHHMWNSMCETLIVLEVRAKQQSQCFGKIPEVSRTLQPSATWRSFMSTTSHQPSSHNKIQQVRK